MNKMMKNTTLSAALRLVNRRWLPPVELIGVLGLGLLALRLQEWGWSLMSPGALVLWVVAGVGLAERGRWRSSQLARREALRNRC